MKIATRWANLASLTTAAILLAPSCSVLAQTTDEPQPSSIVTLQMPAATRPAAQPKALNDDSLKQTRDAAKLDFGRVQPRRYAYPSPYPENKGFPVAVDQLADANVVHTNFLLPPVAAYIAPMKPVTPSARPRVDWHSLAKQSMYFLTIQHSFRFATEPGTREELKGPFFKDWGNSIRGYNGWRDSDPFIVNYVGHPMMGSITGFLEIQNDRDSKALSFGWNQEYWKSRGRAMVFSAIYSTLFEIGPISESSLGNVGLDQRTGGMVDIVVTPTIGTGWLIAEDMIDRYIITKLEGRIGNRPARIFLRGFLNPSRSFANMMAGKEPWLRRDRGGVWYDRR